MLYVIFTIYKTTEHSFVQIKQRLFCRFWNIYFTFHFHSITYTCKLCLCFFSFLLLFTPTIKTSRPLFFCFCFVLFCRKHRIFVFNYVSLVFHFVYQRLRFWFPAFFFYEKVAFYFQEITHLMWGSLDLNSLPREECVCLCADATLLLLHSFYLEKFVCWKYDDDVRLFVNVLLWVRFFYFCEQCGDVFVCLFLRLDNQN